MQPPLSLYRDKIIALASAVGRVGTGVRVGIGELVTDGTGVGVTVGVNVNSAVGDKVDDAKTGVGGKDLLHADTKSSKVKNMKTETALNLNIVRLTFISHQQDLPTLACSDS